MPAYPHMIVKLNWLDSRLEVMLNELGSQRWNLSYIKNYDLYLIRDSAPFLYKILDTSSYYPDISSQLESLGSEGWVLVDIKNDRAFLKRLAIKES